MKNTVRIGIIGCGGIANYKHMPALSKVDNAEMVAFCDIELEKAEKAAREYGVEGAKVYEDYKELLQDKSIDVVHVCTPNRSHSFITIDALEAGKHVMCEKPMAKTAKEARAMCEAAKRTGKKLTIGYQNRFRKDTIALKQLCDRDELGNIYFAKAHAIRRRAVPTWGVFLNEEEQGGGPLIDIGTHALDLTLWMMDNYEPSYVAGSAYHEIAKQKNAGNSWGDWDPEQFSVEDSAFGFVMMKNGATIILESSWAINSLDEGEAMTTLCGSKAGADMKEGLRMNGVDNGTPYIRNVDLSLTKLQDYASDANHEGELEAKCWIECILQNKPPLVLPEQALVISEILEAIYESAESGQPVLLGEH